MIRALPNLLSLARLCLVPVILAAIWNRRYEQAVIWSAVAGVSDALDGFLARRLHAQSRTGAYLDPVADKSLLSGIYLTLGLDRVTPWWLTATVFGRDALMLLFIGIALLFTKIRDFPPSVWGKLSTAIQIVTALTVLLNRTVWIGDVLRPVERALMILAVAATSWSAIHYAWIGLRMSSRSRARL